MKLIAILLAALLLAATVNAEIIKPKTTIPDNVVYATHFGLLFNQQYISEISQENWGVDSLLTNSTWGSYICFEAKKIPTPTPWWMDYYGGNVMVNDTYLIPVGTVMTIRTAEGITCGRTVVETAGKFGFLHTYADDPYSPYIKEGAYEIGEPLYLYLNNTRCTNDLAYMGFGQRVQIKKIYLAK